jgi:hypothetical protein
MNNNYYGFLIKVTIVFLLLYLIFVFFKGKNNFQILKEKGVFTMALIYDWNITAKGSISYKYKFKVNGKSYYDSMSSSKSNINSNDLVNKEFPLIYRIDDPSYNSILCFHEDYKRFNLVVPDSIQVW